LFDDGVTFASLDVRDESKAASVMFMRRVIETLCARRPWRFAMCGLYLCHADLVAAVWRARGWRDTATPSRVRKTHQNHL